MNEQKTIPTPQGPTYNMIQANQIGLYLPNDAQESEMFELIPHWVSLPDYHMDINSLPANRLYVNAELRKRTIYIGKPMRITNAFTNQEVLDFVKDFNAKKYAHITIVEYDDNNTPLIETLYVKPQIIAVNFCQLSTTNNGYKSLKFVMSFEEMENRHAK